MNDSLHVMKIYKSLNEFTDHIKDLSLKSLFNNGFIILQIFKAMMRVSFHRKALYKVIYL